MKIELGKNIKEERIKKKLTQQDLADYLKISRQTISKWELDKSYPDLELLVQMSQLFEVSVDQLLGTQHATEKQKRSILDFIFQTNPEGIYEPSSKERKYMKTICFVVYVSQGINYHHITPYGHFSQIRLINALKKELSPYYDVNFVPSTLEEEPDLYIVPEPFKVLVSYSAEKTLLLPGMLFITKDTAAIKEQIDQYFIEKQTGAC